MSKNLEIIATLVNERRPAGCDNFFIATFRTEDGSTFTAVGNCDEGDLKPYLTYRLYGHWKENERFGRQFAVTTFVLAKPHGKTGVLKYLEQAPHVGAATALQLWNLFSSDAVKICREHPEIIADKIQRIDEKKAGEIAEFLRNLSDLENASIELIDLLSGRGFPKATAMSAIKKFGNRAAEFIQRDPFILGAFRGCGFLRCDSLYMDLGLNPAKLKRQVCCTWYSIASDSSGDIWFRESAAGDYLKAKIAGTEIDLDRAIAVAHRFKGIDVKRWCPTCMNRAKAKVPDLFFGEGMVEVTCPACGGQAANRPRWIADYRKAKAEDFIAKHLVAAESEGPKWPLLTAVTEPGERGPTGHQVTELTKACRGVIGLFCGSPGTGKAQPLDAKVLTQYGWKEMGQIKVGDVVISPDNQRVAVKAVFPQGEKDVYKVTLSDGTSTECCMDHLWFTKSRHDRQNKKPGKVRSLKEIVATLDRGDGSPNHEIPMVGQLDICNEERLRLDPYFFGLLLGDGSFRGGTPAFCKSDDELLDQVRKSIPASCELRFRGNCTYAIASRVSGGGNQLKGIIKKMGLWKKASHEKFIPVEYLRASFKDRLALLQGLLDTDGSCDKSGINVEYSSSSPKLAEDFCQLARSLGATVSVASRIPSYVYAGEKRQGKEAWRILVQMPAGIVPFRLKRKAERFRPRTKYIPRRRIESVEFIGRKQCQCISIDSRDGLYVTNDYIVTHNTYTVAQLIKAVIAQFGSGCIAACGPTGKSARRLTEMLTEAEIQLTATTIHRLLGVESAEEGGWSFIHGANNPLPHQFIIVDEASMPDAGLFASLLAARAKGTHVLCVGDICQLPPVGAGAPLRDMIAAGLPCGKLTEIMRNAGTIVRACAAIRDRKPIPIDGAIELDRVCPDCDGDGCDACFKTGKLPPKNLVLLTASKNNAASTIERKLVELREAGIDAVWDVQVIVAVNKKSPLSRSILNKRLQNLLNPNGKGVQGSPFRVGDKVLCLKNSFFKLAEQSRSGSEFGDVPSFDDDADGKAAVANGEIGRVLEVEPGKTVVQFYHPPRKVVVNRAKGGPADGKGDEKDDSASGKETDSGTGCDLDLAYAVSCHKMQGSEAPYVIVALDEYPGATGRYGICEAEWALTGISRAKIACFLVGLRSTLQTQVSTTALMKRKTFLPELIDLYREIAIQESPTKGIPSCMTPNLTSFPAEEFSPAMAAPV